MGDCGIAENILLLILALPRKFVPGDLARGDYLFDRKDARTAF